MAFTLHQVGVGTALRVITNLTAILDKGAAHCAANKIAESVESLLAPSKGRRPLTIS